MSSKACLLVVDDNCSLVRVYKCLLQKKGYEVITAFDGLEGLWKALKEKPDLIILDIVMPKMDGYEVCHHLQRDPATSKIPVLMLTRVNKRTASLNAGALDFLSKPVVAKEMLARVRGLGVSRRSLAYRLCKTLAICSPVMSSS